MVKHLRRDIGCPWPLVLVHLAERFSTTPWEIETAPADRLLYYAAIMGIEAEAKAAMEGMKPDEEFLREG